MPEICLFDGIGVDPETGTGMTAKQFDAELKALGNPSAFVLRINSPGGSVFDGMAMYSMLKASRATVTARIEGLAASAASLIAMAADRIEIASNAYVLIHQPHTIAQGNAADLATAASDMELLTDQYAKIYAARSGMTLAAVRDLMEEDRLMGAEEAVKLGLADEVIETGAGPDMSTIPARHRGAIKAARREGDHGWGKAIAHAFGGQRPAVKANREAVASWDRVFDKLKAERRPARGPSDRWDAAIRRTFGGTR